MNVRTIALAVPLALGMACMHTQGQGAASPQTQPQAAAGGAATQDPIMQPGPAVQGHAGDEVVAGRIAEVGDGTISIETEQGGTRTLQVVPQTSIEVNGQDASFQDLAQGQPVRASFDGVEGQDVAVKIHAGNDLATPRSGTGSGTSDQGASTPSTPTDQGTAPPSAPDQGTATPPAPTTPPNTGTGQGGSGPPRGW